MDVVFVSALISISIMGATSSSALLFRNDNGKGTLRFQHRSACASYLISRTLGVPAREEGAGVLDGNNNVGQP